MAFFSVRTIASWPTTSSKSCGRYFRYSAATQADTRRTAGALRGASTKGLWVSRWGGQADRALMRRRQVGALDGAAEGAGGLEKGAGTIVGPRRWECVNRVRAGRQQR